MPDVLVTNDLSELLCVFVEPWGEDYWIRRGEALRLTGHPSDGEVEVITHAQGVSVSISSATRVDVIDGEGRHLPCGHQRPPGAFGG